MQNTSDVEKLLEHEIEKSGTSLLILLDNMYDTLHYFYLEDRSF